MQRTLGRFVSIGLLVALSANGEQSDAGGEPASPIPSVATTSPATTPGPEPSQAQAQSLEQLLQKLEAAAGAALGRGADPFALAAIADDTRKALAPRLEEQVRGVVAAAARQALAAGLTPADIEEVVKAATGKVASLKPVDKNLWDDYEKWLKHCRCNLTAGNCPTTYACEQSKCTSCNGPNDLTTCGSASCIRCGAKCTDGRCVRYASDCCTTKIEFYLANGPNIGNRRETPLCDKEQLK